MRKIFTLRLVVIATSILLFFNARDVQAQREATRWFFGQGAGIDFNSGFPVAQLNGKMVSFEGCASIADKNTGDLLFYTNGQTIWDATHDTMLNGNALGVNWQKNTPTQSSVILSMPGSDSLFYVFTADGHQNEVIPAPHDGANYSVVDMSGNGGLGEVIQKKEPLFSPCSEKLIAMKHANCRDYWIIYHEIGNNNFRAYLLTDQGVDTNAYVTTSIGVDYIKDVYDSTQSPPKLLKGAGTAGYMKGSPDGNRIALVKPFNEEVIELYDFDDATGQLSNRIQLPESPRTYGVEFSPDNSKLYVTSEDITQSPSKVMIHQFDLSAGSDSASIASTKTEIHSAFSNTANATMHAIQIAPQILTYGMPKEVCISDQASFTSSLTQNKLYVAKHYFSPSTGHVPQDWIAVINDPNKQGTACNFAFNGFNLGNTVRKSLVGLPNFYGGHVAIYDSVSWDFGDGTVVSNVPNPGYTYDSVGTYVIKLILHHTNPCESDTLIDTITVHPKPVVDLGPDQEACMGDTVTLDAGNPGMTHSWSTGGSTQTTDVTVTGNYTATVTNSFGCSENDVAHVDIHQLPAIDLGPDISVCAGDTAIIEADTSFSGYIWSTGDTTTYIVVSSSGTYTLTVRDTNGCEQNDSIALSLDPLPQPDLGGDKAMCEGASVTLSTTQSYNGYLWQDGSGNASFTTDTAGTFWVNVKDGNGCEGADTIDVSVNPLPQPDLGPDLGKCPENTADLDAGSGYNEYNWSTVETTQKITVTSAGVYHVQVKDDKGCEGADTVEVTDFVSPTVDIGNDTSFCESGNFTLDAGLGFASYEWSDGTSVLGNSQTQDVSVAGIFTVTVTDTVNGCQASDDINIGKDVPADFDLGEDQVVCYGKEIEFDTKVSGDEFWWSTGDSTAKITVGDSGTYIAFVRTGTCVSSDTVSVGYLAKDDDILKIPNVFTPNGDGVNDVFEIEANDLKSFHIKIYNRWGNLLYETDEIYEFWNGKIHNTKSLVSEGTYYYLVQLETICTKDDEPIEDHGTVNVLLGSN